MSQGFTTPQVLDTDVTLANNSDYLAPSEKAVKTYIDARDLSAADLAETAAWANGGTGTHTASDAHIASTANPHSVTAAQVGIVAETNANNIFAVGVQTANSVFSALINGAPTNAANSVVTFDTVTAGNVAVITPAVAGQLARMRLYNSTRGNYALIVSATGATVTVDRNVTTLPAPWLDNDAITITSPTAGAGMADLEVVSGITGKSNVFIFSSIQSTTVGNSAGFHPFAAFSTSKYQPVFAQVNGISNSYSGLATITGNVLSIAWNGNITSFILRETGYIT
jgi:hypothetical protein